MLVTEQGACECPHRWRRVQRSSYRCTTCGKHLKRSHDLGTSSNLPYLFCEGTEGFERCDWPDCVRVPRSLWRRLVDEARALKWNSDAYNEPNY